MPGQLRGELSGAGKVRRGADGQWLGDAHIASPAARLVMLDEEARRIGAGSAHLAALRKPRCSTPISQARGPTQRDMPRWITAASSRASFSAQQSRRRRRRRFAATVDASMPTLAPFAAFVPTVANLDGAVNAKIQIGGTIAAPEFTGNVDAHRLQADLGQLGIELREARRAPRRSAAAVSSWPGSVASGKGHLEFAGHDERARRGRRADPRPELPGGRHPGGQRDRHAGPDADRRSQGLSTARAR